VVEWLRMQPVDVEIAGLTSSEYFTFFSTFFVHFLNPGMTVLLDYLNPAISRLVT